MRNRLTIALVCIALSATAQTQTLPIPDQVQAQPVTKYNEAKAERLRQEQIRLENERLRQQIERDRREAAWRSQQEYESRMKQLEQERLQIEREEREHAQTYPESINYSLDDIAAVAARNARTNNTEQTGDPEVFEILDQLRKLDDLKKDGILTTDEYENLKKKILSSQK